MKILFFCAVAILMSVAIGYCEVPIGTIMWTCAEKLPADWQRADGHCMVEAAQNLKEMLTANDGRMPYGKCEADGFRVPAIADATDLACGNGRNAFAIIRVK